MSATPGLYAAPTLIDRLIAQVSPRAALRRHWDRQMLQRAYEAANPRDSWKPRRPGASANADHEADAGTMRGKARALVQNVPYIRAALEALVANVVGTGITPVFEGAQAEMAGDLWAKWVRECDASGQRDLYGLQALAYRTMEQDGEVLVRYRWRREQDGLTVPLQLQVMEVDWLDTTRQSGAPGSNTTVNGIEYDLLGRKVAYWLWDQHPGEVNGLRRSLKLQSSRVPADLVTHLFRQERPGQNRGFTRFAPVISSARDLRLLQDAELQRKNLETRLGVMVSGDASLFAGPPQQLTPDTAKATGELGPLPSGGMISMPPGTNVTTVAPNPAQGFTDYVKLELHLIMAGIGVPYEEGTGDMKEVNFSSSRVRQQQFRRQCEQTQWLELVPNLCVPILAKFLEGARMVGKLKATPVTADWSTPRWDYVNPQQDVNASVMEIGSGMQSISEHIRRRGYQPKKVFAELKEDIDMLKQIGVFDALMFMLKGRSPGDAAANPPATETTE